MLRKISLLLVILCLSFPICLAQFEPPERSYPGFVQLQEGGVVRGTLLCDLNNNVIRVDRDERQFIFNATQVSSFEIRLNNVPRYFESVSIQGDGGYERKEFFELLIKGPASLYRKSTYLTTILPVNFTNRPNFFPDEELQESTDGQEEFSYPEDGYYRAQIPAESAFGGRVTTIAEILKHKLYIHFPDEPYPVPLPARSAKKLSRLFGADAELVREYMRKNRLLADKMLDVTEVVAFYNRLLFSAKSK